MASHSPSSVFSGLVATWKLLALRSDVDDILLSLLGEFSLEKVYADSDSEQYIQVFLVFVIQLNVIFTIQRLSIPSTDISPVGPSLGYLVSWEVTVRVVEYVLQAIIDARQVLWNAGSTWDEHLEVMLLSALRVLSLHPKPPATARAKGRRDRFARIHQALEKVCDNSPDGRKSRLAVCKAAAEALQNAPETLALPPPLKDQLPTLVADLVSISCDMFHKQHVAESKEIKYKSKLTNAN
jgi:hypothetical protein